jgi:Calcineurin-like phosphoesterase
LDGSPGSSTVGGLPEAVLEQALTAYYRGEGHGGADAVGPRTPDAWLVPTSRRAFHDSDVLPSDAEVLRAIHADELEFIGEGYHVITLVDPFRRFVVKYAKSDQGVPPLAPPETGPGRGEWSRDHGIVGDGCLHPAVWQHIRAFESYGDLAAASRVYISDDGFRRLNTAERHALARYWSIGIVRSMGNRGIRTRVAYPGDFAEPKRPDAGVLAVSVVIAQPYVTPLADAMFRELHRGNPGRASHLLDSYAYFVWELWLHGVSHLDFSILNVGVSVRRGEESLVLFDPHMGVIELSPGGPEVRDPLAIRPEEQRSVAELPRAARDGSRWALWRIQEMAAGTPGIPGNHVAEAAEMVKRFHIATGQPEHGDGLFSHQRFGRTWHRRPIGGINDLAEAHARQILVHPLWSLIQRVLEQRLGDRVYQRKVPVSAMGNDSVLPEFVAGLMVYERRPLLLIANVSDGPARLAKHWGRVLMPGELDIQDDPGIRYHFHDLLTGETYVRSGQTLVHQGLVVGLDPGRIHALQVKDIVADDPVLERALVSDLDFSGYLTRCTRRFGVVGDIHGKLEAFTEVLRALGFIDSSGQWFAGNGTLVLTGDVGHGAHLREVFDYIHRLSLQAHALGGRIVWALGNHDLFTDRDGGQGGEDSLGYQLWPAIRDAVLHQSRHPGLAVTAAYFAHEKIFVHGGVLPHIAELPDGQPGHPGARQVVRHINNVFRAAIRKRERITTGDLAHPIFQVGTSHIAEPKFPEQEGYLPAGIFTADLRELDHYRFRGGSRRGPGRATGERLCRQRGRLTPQAPTLRTSHSRAWSPPYDRGRQPSRRACRCPGQGWPFPDRCNPAAGAAAGPGGAPAAQRGRTTWRRGKTAATLAREEGHGPTIASKATAPEGHLTSRERDQRNPLTQRGFRSVSSGSRSTCGLLSPIRFVLRVGQQCGQNLVIAQDRNSASGRGLPAACRIILCCVYPPEPGSGRETADVKPIAMARTPKVRHRP